jgi:hypothetical protein
VTAAFTAISSELLAGGCGVRFRAEGGSMYPTIRSGELVTVVPVDASSVRLGDILLCDSLGRIVAHRVTAIEIDFAGTPRFTLRGDASVLPDAPIGPGEILARVIAVDRGGRQIRLGRWRPAALRFLERCSLRLLAWFRGRNRRR